MSDREAKWAAEGAQTEALALIPGAKAMGTEREYQLSGGRKRI